MKEGAALDHLCALHGIALEYRDIWGRPHKIDDTAKRALLAAMACEVGTPAALAAALAEAEARPWRRVLNAVLVVSADTQAIDVVFTLPVPLTPAGVRWRLLREDGTREDGELAAAWPRQCAAHQLGDTCYVRYTCALPITPPIGYHELELSGGGLAEPARMRLIVTPAQCYRPPALADGARAWGLGAQLYALRSQRDWGMGDFSDLRTLIDVGADLGADIIGVNPLHALFLHNPGHASPYSPTSRLFLNVLYIDVEAVAEYGECAEARAAVEAPEFQAALRALRADELVDYAAVAARKRAVLELLYRHFRDRHLAAGSGRGHAFQAYRQAEGGALRRYALFEALQEHLHAADPSCRGWPAWPAEYRDPDGAAVAAYAADHQERIELFEYLQWLAEQQLAAVGRRSLERGLAIGLYTDLAVGVDGGGAEAWADQGLYALGARIGSPPDDFNLAGQDWGLPPPIPARLVEAGYAPFITTLRRNMRHAGALRIDHVMALMRLFWVPAGRPPTEGSYVAYPFEDLLGILALESQRNRCLVIGEDLGTVPEEMHAALQELGVLSYRLLYFEKGADGEFAPPADFPAQALAAISTHDLPTLAGYWEGVDLECRTTLGLFPSEAARTQQIVARAEDRARLLLALERERLLPAELRPDPVAVPEMSDTLTAALHAYLARSAAEVMVVRPEDVLGQREQVNLPGTTDRYPNWRRKLPLDLDAWRKDHRLQNVVRVVRQERGLPEHPAAPPPRPAACAGGRRLPTATYRLQFNRDFTFAAAAALVPYLAALGVSHCYASPYLKARPGSRHGYDIIDHNALNPEIGSNEDYERFVVALAEHGIGHILDIVPNHMGIMGADNNWWLDVLENGEASAYADFFDIDWQAMSGNYQDKVLVPVLGDHYGVVLERGELTLRFDREAGAFSVHYFEHRFPVDPKEYPQILGYRSERLEARLGADHAELRELQSLTVAFRNLPARTHTAEEKRAERQRDKEIHKANLAALCRRCADIAWFIDENVASFNGTAGEPASFQLLHHLLHVQAYRLSYWRAASDEINYRRFFDVNDLAGLRMENPRVFEHTHRLVGELLAAGKLDGLRIDHPDGLYDPLQYFERLRTLAPAAAGGERTGGPYIVVEKILAAYERLPEDWPVHGTTGYEFGHLVGGLFVDPAAETKLDRLYSSFIHEHIDFNELLYDTKKLIMRVALASELGVLAGQLVRIAHADPRVCDFTQNGLRDALTEVVACFPVYRTYITEAGASAEGRRYVEWAVSVAKRRSQAADISIFDFVREVLLTDAAEGKADGYRRAVVNFAMKFQQYTGPLMAKGLEDTSFYIYNRLISLNEVGGDPRRYATSVADFHRANQHRLQFHPHTMLATSTHDSKRSEDVRLRIAVLSELPEMWRKHLARWTRLNRAKKRRVDDRAAPSRNDEYLLYQTLVGVWPVAAPDEAGIEALRERIEAYMIKALREAKTRTSWINPNVEYEEAMLVFVRALLAKPARNPFLTDFLPLVARLTYFGLLNSLSQALLKLTVPGMPDIYQGNELWDFSLVDPDNRRPVDYDLRRARLADIQGWFQDVPQRRARLRGLLDRLGDGDAKLLVTWRCLTLRRRRPRLFQQGAYIPLTVDGARAAHLCAYARRHAGVTLVVLAPRLYARLCDGEVRPPLGALWGDTRIELPPNGGESYTDLYTGDTPALTQDGERRWLAAAAALADFPVALLIAGDDTPEEPPE